MSPKTIKNDLTSFLQRPFPLLDDAKSKWFLIVFCAGFGTFFIYYFNPFNIQSIKYYSAIGNALPVWSAGILGGVVLSFSQFILRPRLNFDKLTAGKFFLWVLLDFSLMCLATYFIFGETKHPFFKEFFLIMEFVVSLAFLPYLFACLLIAVFKLYIQVKQEPDIPVTNPVQHSFKDENGKIILVLPPENILFLKSENNYTAIFFTQNGKVDKKLIRNNLKNLENDLKDPNLLRIHRSYMVNIQNLDSIQRKKGGFQIQMKQMPETTINVSETYRQVFEARIQA